LYERVANEYKDTTFARDAEVMLGELMAGGPAPAPAQGTAPAK
jgi:hypothetical protein